MSRAGSPLRARGGVVITQRVEGCELRSALSDCCPCVRRGAARLHSPLPPPRSSRSPLGVLLSSFCLCARKRRVVHQMKPVTPLECGTSRTRVASELVKQVPALGSRLWRSSRVKVRLHTIFSHLHLVAHLTREACLAQRPPEGPRRDHPHPVTLAVRQPISPETRPCRNAQSSNARFLCFNVRT